jgi:hypothetical protein
LCDHPVCWVLPIAHHSTDEANSHRGCKIVLSTWLKRPLRVCEALGSRRFLFRNSHIRDWVNPIATKALQTLVEQARSSHKSPRWAESDDSMACKGFQAVCSRCVDKCIRMRSRRFRNLKVIDDEAVTRVGEPRPRTNMHRLFLTCPSCHPSTAVSAIPRKQSVVRERHGQPQMP